MSDPESEQPEGQGPADPSEAPPPDAVFAETDDVRYYFDESVAGRPVTCEGGAPIEGTQTAARATYIGVATGRRLDQGDPPWRWLELIGRDPDSPGEQQLVWCEENFLFFEDEDD